MESAGFGVAAIQIPTMTLGAHKFEYLFKQALERKAKVVLLGEYVVNHFFFVLKTMQPKMVNQQTQQQIKRVQNLIGEQNVVALLPVVRYKNSKPYKSIAKITSRGVRYIDQQILIGYKHWDEASFFANNTQEYRLYSFMHEGMRIAIMYGYEMHFLEFWQEVKQKKVDLLLMPSASTFASSERWTRALQTQAFLAGCYILRANRLGSFEHERSHWYFYGDSMLVNPDGDIEMLLEDRESMLLEYIDKSYIRQSRKEWGFGRYQGEFGGK